MYNLQYIQSWAANYLVLELFSSPSPLIHPMPINSHSWFNFPQHFAIGNLSTSAFPNSEHFMQMELHSMWLASLPTHL